MNRTAILILAAIAVLLVSEILSFILKKARPASQRLGTVVTLIRSVIRYAALFFIVFVILEVCGLDPKSILAGIGILALIISFCAESLIEDMLTGIAIIFENQYNVGDIVDISGFRGTVTEMGIRTTAVMDGGGNIKIFNNSDMKNVINRSQAVSKAVCDINLPMSSDIDRIERDIPSLLSGITTAHPDVFVKPVEYQGIQSLNGEIGIRFTADCAEQDIYQAQRILNHDVLLAFRKAGIM